MATQVTKLQVIVDAETAGAENALRRVAGAIQGLIELGGRVAGAVSAPFQGLADVLGKIGLAAMGVQALAGAVSGIGQTLIGTNIQFENTRAALTAFTGSGEEAARLLAVIRQEAAQTPFAFKDMAQAVTMLLPASKAAGLEIMELVKRAELLAALNPAEGLTGAAFALREALSGDFVSLVERFNLPRQYINQLKEEGVPALEIVDRVLQQMGVSTDLVANLAQTASGRWSTFVDTLEMLKATAMEAFFQRLSSTFGQFVDWLSANQPLLEAFAATVGEKLASAFDRVLTTAQAVLPVVRAAIGEFIAGFQGANVDSFVGRLGGALGAFVGFLTGTVVPAVSQAMAQFWSGFRTGEGEGLFARLGAAGAAFLGWLSGTFIPQVMTAIEQFKAGLRGEGDGSFFANLGQGVANIATTLQQAMPALRELGNFLTGTLIPALQRLGGAAEGPLGTLVSTISSQLPTVLPMLATAAAAFTGLQIAASALGTVVSPVMTFVSALRGIAGVTPLISMIVSLLGGPLTIALAAIAAAVGVAAVAWMQNWGNIQQHTQTAIQNISSTVSTIGSVLQSAFASVMQAAQPVISAVGGLAQQLFQDWAQWLQQIAPTAQEAFQNVVSFISTIASTIMSVLSTVGSAIMAFVNANREGLVQIVQGAWQVISSLIMGVSEMIQGVLTVIISLLAGDWRMAWEGAKQVVQAFTTMVQGILQGAVTIIIGILRVLVNTAYQILSEGWQRARGAVERAWEAIKTKISEVRDRVIEIVRDMVEQVVSKARELVDKFREIGNKIVDALVNAIKAGISRVISAVKELASSAISAAMDVLGIRSPSRVFADIGTQAVQGLTSALAAGTTAVRESVRQLLSPAVATASELLYRLAQLGQAAFLEVSQSTDGQQVFEPATPQQTQSPFGPQFLESIRLGLEQARALIQKLAPETFAPFQEQLGGIATEASQFGPNLGVALQQGLASAQAQVAASAAAFRQQALAPLDVSQMAMQMITTLSILGQTLPALVEPIRYALAALDIRPHVANMVAAFTQISNAITQALRTIQASINAFNIEGAIQNLVNTLNQFGATLATGFLAQIRLALPALEQGWREVVKRGEDAFTELAQMITQVCEGIIQVVEHMVERIKDLMGQMKSEFLGIGVALVDGVIQALSNAQDAMVRAVVSVLKASISVARETLGIASPSRVFYEIGEQMMAGLALGVESGAERSVRALIWAVERMKETLQDWNPRVSVAWEVPEWQRGDRPQTLAFWFSPY